MSRQTQSLWHQTRILGADISVYRVSSEADSGQAPHFHAVNQSYRWLGSFYRGATEPTMSMLTQRLESWRRRRVGFLLLTGAIACLLLISL